MPLPPNPQVYSKTFAVACPIPHVIAYRLQSFDLDTIALWEEVASHHAIEALHDDVYLQTIIDFSAAGLPTTHMGNRLYAFLDQSLDYANQSIAIVTGNKTAVTFILMQVRRLSLGAQRAVQVFIGESEALQWLQSCYHARFASDSESV